MKRFLLIILLTVSCLCTSAQQVAEVWISMPDSVCPFINEQQRLSLIQYAKAGLTDTIVNQFDGKTYLDSVDLQNNYISAQITANMRMELTTERIIVLQVEDEAVVDECIRIRTTVCAPICSTFTTWYDFVWNIIKREKSPWQIDQTDDEKVQHF